MGGGHGLSIGGVLGLGVSPHVETGQYQAPSLAVLGDVVLEIEFHRFNQVWEVGHVFQ